MIPAKKVSVPLVGFADAARESAGIERITRYTIICPVLMQLARAQGLKEGINYRFINRIKDAARKSAGIESP